MEKEKTKRLKDPIYGYIDVPQAFMTNIIDTAAFQRLKRIIHTSFSPLYSSAVHNRFVHSMGVYHLGDMAFAQLRGEIERKFPGRFDLDSLGKVFLTACLLHDVGHAPFSHSGEVFYLDEDGSYGEIHAALAEAVGSDAFGRDVPKERGKSAAPHEVMSALVGLHAFPELFADASEREFFARCITGYKYTVPTDENSMKNCFVSLLNSNVIDVDKLDYLIRDAYISGFNTVNIDYERLLKSLTIARYKNRYKLAYYKNAVSVIENVIYARDAERKWIHSHPIVVYEIYILQRIMAGLSEKIRNMSGKKLFSLQSLSGTGQDFGENLRIRLLSDDDIVYLMKNVFPNELSEEYFERSRRRHAVWKSEAEYKAFFLSITNGGELLERFEQAMGVTARYLERSPDLWKIDEHLLTRIEAELAEIEASDLSAQEKWTARAEKEEIRKLLRCLKRYADENQIAYDFVLISASQFNSGFGKQDFSETSVVFPLKGGEEKLAKVGDIVSSLLAKDSGRKEFFYLFYRKGQEPQAEIDGQELCRTLIREFI